MWKDSETNIDYLNIQYIIEMIKNIVGDEKLSPATIGVYGDWGSGKSSIIEISLQNFLKDTDVVTVKFNGWLFEGYDDAKTVLLSTILDELVKQKKITSELQGIVAGLYKSIDKIKLAKSVSKIGLDVALTGGTVTGSQLFIEQARKLFNAEQLNSVSDGQIQETLNSIQKERNFDDFRKDINDFRENFSRLIDKTKVDKIVVYIDELDRCNPDTILETLEAIRLFVFVEKIYFIIGADERHIQYSVQRKFANIEGNQINIGKEYLEKIIQYPINIPRMRTSDVEFYLLALLCEKEVDKDFLDAFLKEMRDEKMNKPLSFNITNFVTSSTKYKKNETIKPILKLSRNLAPILSRELNGNPRQCKRFLNMLIMRKQMAAYNKQALDLLILSKIMLLEYFKPEIFDFLMDAVINGRKEVWNEISKAEKDPKYEFESPILKKLKDTVWGEVWFKLDPALGEEELEVYFYYSRENNKGKDDLITFKLSPIAKQILDMLDKRNHNFKEEVKNLNNGVSIVDQQEILEIYYNEHIDKKDFIEPKKFDTLIFYGGLNQSLLPNLIHILNTITGQSFTVGVAPYIVELRKLNPEQEIIEITERWIQENKDLKKPIEIMEKG